MVDIVVNRQKLWLPPKIILNQAARFNFYAMRAVLNGRGDEIIDLAKNRFNSLRLTALTCLACTYETFSPGCWISRRVGLR